jgi:hypothetical protein
MEKCIGHKLCLRLNILFERVLVLLNILLVAPGMQSQDHEKVVLRIISLLLTYLLHGAESFLKS